MNLGKQSTNEKKKKEDGESCRDEINPCQNEGRQREANKCSYEQEREIFSLGHDKSKLDMIPTPGRSP